MKKGAIWLCVSGPDPSHVSATTKWDLSWEHILCVRNYTKGQIAIWLRYRD